MSHQYNQMVVAQQHSHQSQVALNELALANMLSNQSLNGNSTQQLQQLTSGQNNALNGNNNNNNSNTNNLAQPTILMTPMMAPMKPAHMYAQQQMQHPNQMPVNQVHGQASFNQSAILQQQMIANGQQQQQPQQQQQQQQVPINTISIPAATVSQLQNVSMQIQQAAQQAAPNQQQPQILVFMIPYMINPQQQQHLQQQLNSQQQQQQQQHILPHPITPDQASLNSTLVRQSHSNSSIMRQSHPSQPIQQQQQQQQPSTGPSSSATHSRAVSSLSNATITTATKQSQEPEKFYIKANFSYQPTRNRQELSFKKGDILHVLDTLQNNDYGVQYWLATRVKANGEDAEKGLIPNKNKAEEITMEQRTLDISEHASGTAAATNGSGGSNGPGMAGTLDGSSASGGGGVLSASVGRVNFLKRRSAQRSKSLCKDNWDNVVFDIGSFRLPAYERVVYKHPGFCRPVVIFGPLSDLARQKLLKDYPEKYSYPSGISQSPDHPKVIRLKGVIDVIDQGKHALLDITAQAVEKLNYVNLAPIVIFMKTDSKSIIKEFRSRAAKSLDPSARDEDTLRRDGKSSRKLLEQSVKLEKQWSHVFTATLDLSTMGSEMWYRKLRETIENQQSANVWMGEKKSEKKLAAAVASSSSLGTSSMLMANQTISDGQSSQLYGAASQLGGRNTQLMASNSSSSNLTYHGQTAAHQQSHSLGAHGPNTMGDSSSMLSDKPFNECLNISQQGGTKSTTNDLIPLPGGHIDNAGLYGNRSQLRNAYAHSLAQKLARASSEPKLNGLMSDDNEDDDDDDDVDHHEDDEEDDEDDDDDEIIKKPPLFPSEFENSSSISSSNGIGGGGGGGGPSTNYGHSSLTGASSSSSNAQLQHHPAYQQHSSSYQMLPQIKPPAPLPPQAAAAAAAAAAAGMTVQQHEQSMTVVSDQQHHMQQQQQQQQQHHHHHHNLASVGSSHLSLQLAAGPKDNSIYSMNGGGGGDQIITANGNGAFTSQQQQQQQQMRSSNKASDYYPLPPMPSDNGYSSQQQQSHSQQMHSLQQQQAGGGSIMHGTTTNQVAPNNHQHQHLQAPAPTPTNGNTISNNNQVIDLTRNHDTRGSAFQIYSDMNQNSYHYYNMNKI